MFGLFARKGPFDANINSGGQTVTVKAGENLLKAALDAGIPWPHNCRVGSCGQCRTKLVDGKIKELNDFSYVLSAKEMDDGMILACQTCLRSDIEVEVPLEAPPNCAGAESIHGQVDSYRHLTHDIIELGVSLEKPMPKYLAGQYADLTVEGLSCQPRSYSFACAPEDDGPTNRVSFFIRLVPGGQMTTWLHASDRSGNAVTVNGPFGNFWLRESDAPVMLICGGSGMAPIMALLQQMSREGFDRDVTLIFGARAQKDLYCLDELEALRERANGNFSFIPVLSEEPEDSDWSGARGLCTEVIATAHDRVPQSHAYLCGPPGMVDAAISELNAQGVDDANIHYDKFLDASHMPAGRAAVG